MCDCKRFPNEFSNWHETHFEIVSVIAIELNKNEITSPVIKERYEQQGHGGMYDLAEELTDQFETEYEKFYQNSLFGVELEYFDTVQEFINKNLYPNE